MVRAFVGQTVNERGIAVESEDNGFVGGEDGIEFVVGKSVRMFGRGCSVMRSTTLTTRILMSGEFWRSRATAARVSRVGISPAQAITTSGSLPFRCRPNPRCQGLRAMLDRGFHVEVLQRRLFAGDDHVHVVPAAQTVVRDREHELASGGR